MKIAGCNARALWAFFFGYQDAMRGTASELLWGENSANTSCVRGNTLDVSGLRLSVEVSARRAV